jgi:hypothetical protein
MYQPSASVSSGLFHLHRGEAAGAARLPDRGITGHDVNRMRPRALVFAFFAAAMLFSMVREWSAPAGCPRLEMTRKVRLREKTADEIRFAGPVPHGAIEIGRDSTGGHLDSALSFPHSLQGDFHVLIALQAWKLLSPLDQ